MHLELEVNLLVRNVVEREIERERVQMKPPMDTLVQELRKEGWTETAIILCKLNKSL